jgi:hypothetical protein
MKGTVPRLPRVLGFAGLFPQFACLAAVLFGGAEWRWSALAIAWAYAALILSFLGGTWWGLAAAADRSTKSSSLTARSWMWAVAVAPSLIALATFVPWIVGAEWPGPSLLVLGAILLATPLVDRRLTDLAPNWWLALRRSLSLGLGAATILIGIIALADPLTGSLRS